MEAHAPSRPRTRDHPLVAPIAIGAIAVLLRVLSGVYFANYDTLYALVWGQQLARGQTPQYGVSVAPTPHPLVEALGFVLTPFGPRVTEDVTVALGYLALAACGWVVYALGREWFGRAAGIVAAIALLTRVDIINYGVRAYVDVPYMLAVLSALLYEARRPKAGVPVLILLGLAGLLRPEAWVFSGLYWLYLLPGSSTRRRVELAALVAVAPLIWVCSDWAITGHPLWSLTNTRHTAQRFDRVTGIANVPEYIPRRIGEILAVPGLVGAALGGVLSLAWLRERARLGAIVGVVAVAVFALFATFGLPINTRYAFLAAAILCIYLGAGVCGWTQLARGDARRRVWMVASGFIVLVALAFAPHQYHALNNQLSNLRAQQRIQNDLVALVDGGSITLRCGPVGVPDHAPVPLLALRLKAPPSNIVSAEIARVPRGTYVAAANGVVAGQYLLDKADHPRRRSTGLAGRLPAGRQSIVARVYQALHRADQMDRAPSVEIRCPVALRQSWLRPGGSRCACR